MVNVIPIWLVGADGCGKKTLQQYFNHNGKYITINSESGKKYYLETQILSSKQNYIPQQALCVIFVYSILDMQSFKQIEKLSKEFKASVKILIGTHRDKAQNREVSYEHAETLVTSLQGIWGECGYNDERNKNQLREQIINRVQFFLENLHDEERENLLAEVQQNANISSSQEFNQTASLSQKKTSHSVHTQQQQCETTDHYKQNQYNHQQRRTGGYSDQKYASGEDFTNNDPEQDSDSDKLTSARIHPSQSRIQRMYIPRTIKLTNEDVYYTIPGELIKELDTNCLRPTRQSMLQTWKQMLMDSQPESQKYKIRIQTGGDSDNQELQSAQTQSSTFASIMLGNTVKAIQNHETPIKAHTVDRSHLLNEIFNGSDCDFILSLQIKDKEQQIGIKYTDNAYQLAKDFGATQHLSQHEINKISVLILENIQNRMNEQMTATKGKPTYQSNQQMLNNISFNRPDDRNEKKRGRKLIFQLELEINGQVYIIPFKEGDTPEGLSSRICETMGLDAAQYQQRFIQKIESSYNQYLKYHQTAD